ncbi:MAG TPA: DUF4258 domain-containing protein [Flavobacteriaceae bacterium]|nr:DUF4258 domain-containing protein [Flavobacteriaceae bacterium]
MKLIQRIGYYLGGFSIGLVLLAFFLNGKRASCDYGPQARVLKKINSKNIEYSTSVAKLFEEDKIDSASIKNVLLNGKINFSKSDARKKPCGLYFIENKQDNENISMIIENCDDLVIIKEIK